MNTRKNVRWITLTAVLLALTLAVQMVGLPQPLTGPAVNAMLILSTAFVGPTGGIIIGALTPFVAFMRGILAAPLAPMIPFIMIGNGVLVFIFWLFRRFISNKLFASIGGIIVGAVAKYLILSSAVNFIVVVPKAVAHAMQLPQLITALIGGAIALAIEGTIKIYYSHKF